MNDENHYLLFYEFDEKNRVIKSYYHLYLVPTDSTPAVNDTVLTDIYSYY